MSILCAPICVFCLFWWKNMVAAWEIGWQLFPPSGLQIQWEGCVKWTFWTDIHLGILTCYFMLVSFNLFFYFVYFRKTKFEKAMLAMAKIHWRTKKKRKLISIYFWNFMLYPMCLKYIYIYIYIYYLIVFLILRFSSFSFNSSNTTKRLFDVSVIVSLFDVTIVSKNL